MTISNACPPPPRAPASTTPVGQHIGRALLHMGSSAYSERHRQNIEFLRANANEAVHSVSGYLFEEQGSFKKWQLAYLIGEFGDAAAISALRRWVALPLPKPEAVGKDPHRTDLAHTEEVSARAQAVASIARIASRRPALRDQAIEDLISIAHESSAFKGAALFELRMLLGHDFETLRGRFGPEDGRHFNPFMPPPEWQGLLQHRMVKHDQQRRMLVANRERLCRLN